MPRYPAGSGVPGSGLACFLHTQCSQSTSNKRLDGCPSSRCLGKRLPNTCKAVIIRSPVSTCRRHRLKYWHWPTLERTVVKKERLAPRIQLIPAPSSNPHPEFFSQALKHSIQLCFLNFFLQPSLLPTGSQSEEISPHTPPHLTCLRPTAI